MKIEFSSQISASFLGKLITAERSEEMLNVDLKNGLSASLQMETIFCCYGKNKSNFQ